MSDNADVAKSAFAAILLAGLCITASAPAAQPDLKCSIHAVSSATDTEFVLGGCNVALKKVTLKFQRPERGKPYFVSNGQPGRPPVHALPGGSGTDTLTLNLPTPVLPGGIAKSGCLTHVVVEWVRPALATGTKTTVSMTSTRGQTATAQQAATSSRSDSPHCS